MVKFHHSSGAICPARECVDSACNCGDPVVQKPKMKARSHSVRHRYAFLIALSALLLLAHLGWRNVHAGGSNCAAEFCQENVTFLIYFSVCEFINPNSSTRNIKRGTALVNGIEQEIQFFFHSIPMELANDFDFLGNEVPSENANDIIPIELLNGIVVANDKPLSTGGKRFISWACR